MTAPSALPSGLAVRHQWRSFGRRGLLNQITCVTIAGVFYLLSGADSSFIINWVYSACIGTLCWLFIDGGRMLMTRALPATAPLGAVAQSPWPGRAALAGLIVVGTVAGIAVGGALGDAITGLSIPSILRNKGAAALSLITAIVVTYYFYSTERLKLEQAAAEAARRIAAEHQLKLLESQLEPHMLFNTLANLRVLIGTDPPRAQAMLDRLIQFLRAMLAASRTGSHSLADEFARLSDYLELMQIRMGDRLQTQLSLPADLAALPVPPLLLQPLVENAIKHGLEPSVAGGRIEVSAAREGVQLVLRVRDTGLGLSSAASAGTKFGLAQVRERLAALHGERASLTLVDASNASDADDTDGGALATLRLPIPTAADT